LYAEEISLNKNICLDHEEQNDAVCNA
jgi:hypothetical protein